MRNDICPAALRLMAALPVRTHSARLPTTREVNHARPVKVGGVRYESLTEAARAIGCNRDTLRKHLQAGDDSVPRRGKGGHNARGIVVGEVRYASLTEAQSALGIGPKALRRMLDAGEARYD